MSKKFSDFLPINTGEDLAVEIDEKRRGDGNVRFVGYTTPDSSDDQVGEQSKINISDLTDAADPSPTDLVPIEPLRGTGSEFDVLDLIDGTADLDSLAYQNDSWGIEQLPIDTDSTFVISGGTIHLPEPDFPEDDFLTWDGDEEKWTPGEVEAHFKTQLGALEGDGTEDDPLTIREPPDPSNASAEHLVKVDANPTPEWTTGEISVGSGLEYATGKELRLWPLGVQNNEVYGWDTSGTPDWKGKNISEFARPDGTFVEGGGGPNATQETSLSLSAGQSEGGSGWLHKSHTFFWDVDTQEWERRRPNEVFPLGMSRSIHREPDYPNFINPDYNPTSLSRQRFFDKITRHKITLSNSGGEPPIELSLGSARLHEVTLETTYTSPLPALFGFELNDLIPGVTYQISIKAGNDSRATLLLDDDMITLGSNPDTDIISGTHPITEVANSKGLNHALDKDNVRYNCVILTVIAGTDTAYAKIVYPSGGGVLSIALVDGDDWVSWRIPQYDETVIRWNSGTGSFQPYEGEIRVDFLDQGGGGPGGVWDSPSSQDIGRGGGGGGGGTITGTAIISAPVAINVGDRSDTSPNADSGNPTQGFGGTVLGGGAGGRQDSPEGKAGASGGGSSTGAPGGAGDPSQGRAGGAGVDRAGGGGGGRAEEGHDAVETPGSPSAPGTGGSGLLSNITGVSEYYGAGGGGAGATQYITDAEDNGYSTTFGSGGLGGGGQGSGGTNIPGGAHHGWGGRGGGAGGWWDVEDGGKGDRGCVIARGRFTLPYAKEELAKVAVEGEFKFTQLNPEEAILELGPGAWTCEIQGIIPFARVAWISGGGGGGVGPSPSGGGGGGAGGFTERELYGFTGSSQGFSGFGGESEERGGDTWGFGTHLPGGAAGAGFRGSFATAYHRAAGACGGGSAWVPSGGSGLNGATLVGGTPLIGYSGGDSTVHLSAAGGGGGMFSKGGEGNSAGIGPNGGEGWLSNIAGSMTFYCAGGGAGSGSAGGGGGSGGAGGEGVVGGDGKDATTYGSGGGGSKELSGQTWVGGRGGDGRVIIRGAFTIAGLETDEFIPTPPQVSESGMVWPKTYRDNSEDELLTLEGQYSSEESPQTPKELKEQDDQDLLHLDTYDTDTES